MVPGSNGDYVFAQIQYTTGQVPANQANIVTNFSDELFHLGITNRSTSASANFGYFSAFSYLNIGKNFEVCLNDSVVLDAGPGKTAYNWSTGDTTQTTTVYEPGTYFVEVFSGTDCFATDSIVVDYYQLPVDLGPNDTICENTSLIISIDGNYNFSWQDGSNESFFEVTEAGTYWVDVSDFQECALRDSIDIAISPRPETPELTGETAYCEGETIELFMNDFDNANYRYILPSGDIVSGQNLVINNAVPSQSGMYYGYYVEEGCETFNDSLEITISPAPEVDLGDDISVCDDVEVVLDPGALNGDPEWQDGSTTNTFSVQESGTYILTVTNDIGCSGKDTVEVVLRYTPATPVVTGDLVYCEGETIELSTPFEEGVFYLWNRPDGTSFGTTENGEYVMENATLAADGIYSVNAQNLGCFSGTATFTIDVNPNPVFTLRSDTTICDEETIDIAGPAGNESYSWNNSETTQNITAGAGIYELTVTDANGCTATDAVEITEQGPNAAFTVLPSLIGNPGTIFTFQDNSEAGLLSIITWLWEFGDGSIDLNQNAVYEYDQSGTFPVTLTVQDEGGCEDKAVQVVTIRDAFKIPEGFSPNSDGVNDVFEIQGLDGLSNVSIQIFNRWGAVVFESNNYGPGNFWDGKDNTDGTFFYVLKVPNTKPVSGSVTIAR